MVVERNNFVVVNLPKNVIAELGTKVFQFVSRIEVEQGFVNVLKLCRDSVRNIVLLV